MKKRIVQLVFVLGLCTALAVVVYSQLNSSKSVSANVRGLALPADNCLECHLLREKPVDVPLEGG